MIDVFGYSFEQVAHLDTLRHLGIDNSKELQYFLNECGARLARNLCSLKQVLFASVLFCAGVAEAAPSCEHVFVVLEPAERCFIQGKNDVGEVSRDILAVVSAHPLVV